MSQLPFSIFQYSGALEFVQDAYEYLHGKDETFSYDRIAELAGFKSRTEARSVIRGSKKASDAALARLADIFGLDKEEKQYFLFLSHFGQAGSSLIAYDLFQKLLEMQRKHLPNENPFRQVEIATSVLHMTLLSFLELSQADQNPDEISAILKYRYTSQEISTALSELEAVGYVGINPTSGRLELRQKHIQKYDRNSNFFLKRFHKESLSVAADALENESPEKRYLVGASFSINRKIYPRIIQKMNAFAENLMQLEGVAGESDMVVQFNQQLIQMTVEPVANERGLGSERTERGLNSNEESVIA